MVGWTAHFFFVLHRRESKGRWLSRILFAECLAWLSNPWPYLAT